MTDLTQPIRQLGTHRKLVSQTEQREPHATLGLDAIVVPASRPAPNLEQAITLAQAAQCALLILCSHQMKPAEVRQLLAKRSFNEAIVIGLPENYRHELLDFCGLASIKDDLPAACSYYVTDLSTKRNVGLLLARMLGWRRIFFLDDDIRGIKYPDLQATVSMLSFCRTAGMRVAYFPDNSVACHAHRMTGGLQDVFISGAVLAVDCQQNIGFFADVYNEDWLFFLNDAASGLLGSSGRVVTQLPYAPFADPRRAAWQEFGDVLAEGLYALLDHDMGVEYATTEYWLYFLAARQRFLEAIIRRTETAKPEIREQLQLSVEAALKCSVTIDPELLERYVWLWRRDLRDWDRRVAGIGQMSSLEVALKELGLEQWTVGGVVDITSPSPEALTEEPLTMRYTLPGVYDRLESGAGAARRMVSGRGKRSGSNRQANIPPHHGSLVREGSRLASALRAFRKPGLGYARTDPSSAPDAAKGARTN